MSKIQDAIAKHWTGKRIVDVRFFNDELVVIDLEDKSTIVFPAESFMYAGKEEHIERVGIDAKNAKLKK